LMVHGSWLKAHGSWPREARGGSWLMARGRPDPGDPRAGGAGPGFFRFLDFQVSKSPKHNLQNYRFEISKKNNKGVL
jgi:hypothetical protein